ncbi:heme ABC transporter permease [Thioalkalivibrio denitrificans]|uniref:Heme ABC transporter permease n=1 Tax=Thioalkalivibrio denitrificans TaxID=108003 RepID=A0A1V3NCN9_9GAMM|nr:DUF2231 domain-containing protein [Thioalkalivibrio denitrificans]OOG22703.1 heme ABC transporter permease [Thioalkalivibrio denitrificans]
MGPYHTMLIHFPIAFWVTATVIIIVRAVSDGWLAQAFDRVLVPFLFLGMLSGIGAYVLGMMVWPPDTLQTSPLGRNHMMAASWSLVYWTALMFMRWRVGPSIWDSTLNRVIMLLLGGLGGLLLVITATIGGHLAGSATYLTDLLRMIGWEVYATFYVPNWMLLVLVILIIAMPLVALMSRRTA